MLDLTPSRILKGRAAAAIGVSRFTRPFRLRRLMPMRRGNSPISRVPRNICAVLAVLLAAGLVWAAWNLIPLRSAKSVTVISVAGKRAQIVRIDAQVKEILDRPLFNSDRSPPPAPPSARELAALQRPVLKSHLTGITISTGLRLAIFVSDGHTYVSVKEGGQIDGFKVQSIAPDRVILASAFGEQAVQPSKGTYQTVRNTKPIELGNFDPDKH
jgi:hypothetical protein